MNSVSGCFLIIPTGVQADYFAFSIENRGSAVSPISPAVVHKFAYIRIIIDVSLQTSYIVAFWNRYHGEIGFLFFFTF